MSSLLQLVGPVQDFAAEIAQELLVIGVFVVSFMVWRHVDRHGIFGFGALRLGTARKGCRAGIKPPVRKCDVPQVTMPPAATLCKPNEGRARLPGRVVAVGSAPRKCLLDEVQAKQAKNIEQQMMKNLTQREFTMALNLYRTAEREGLSRFFVNEELYSLFIQAAVRIGKIDVVERKLSLMTRNGVIPSVEFWHTTLKMLSSRRHFSICLSIYSMYGSMLPEDKVIFSCILNASLESGTPDRVASILPRYLKANLEVQDYVIAFRVYQALDDVDGSEALLQMLKAQITPLMLNLLLLTCVNCSQADRALVCIRQAHKYEAAQRGAWKSTILRRTIVDSISYNIVIKGFAAEGQLEQCFECIKLMHENGVEHDNVTLATLKDACLHLEGGVNVMDRVIGLLLKGDQPLDKVPCTLFIKSLVRGGGGEHLDQAFAIYEEMKRRGSSTGRPALGVAVYSIMVKAFVDAKDLERALSVVQDMAQANEKPDEVIFTHLLEGCRHTANHALGVRIFEDMLAAGVQPSEFTVATMVKLHGRCGEHELAYQLVATCEKEIGVTPTVIHFTCLMSGCLRTRSYDQAWGAYELMLERGVEPDSTAVGTLLPAMIAAQHWDRVLHVVRKALEATPMIPVANETMNNALVQMHLAAEASCESARKAGIQLRGMLRSAGLRTPALNSRTSAVRAR